MIPIRLERNISKTIKPETSDLACSFASGMPSRRTNKFPESGRDLGHVAPTIFGSTVGYVATAWLLVFHTSASKAMQRAIQQFITAIPDHLSVCHTPVL